MVGSVGWMGDGDRYLTMIELDRQRFLRNGDAIELSRIDHGMQMPHASILVPSSDDCRRLAKLYRHLCAQTVAHQLELVVCGPPGFTQTARLEPGPLASVVFTEVEHWPATLGQMREACLRLASAEIVIFGEDHSHPAPDWAEHLIAAHEAGWHGVGASVANGNPATAVSWADQLASYGRFSANGMSGVSE